MLLFGEQVSKTSTDLLKVSISHYNEACLPHFPLKEEDKSAWYLPKELISFHKHPSFAELSIPEKIKVSQLELINFFSLTIHGESFLCTSLQNILSSPLEEAVRSYLLKFIEEEEMHSYWFNKFCESENSKIYSDKNIVTGPPREFTKNHLLSFFLKVFIFEQVSLAYNNIISKDDSIPRLIREINNQHVIEEARHLNFGRQLIDDLFRTLEPDHPEIRAEMSAQMDLYRKSLIQQFFNDEVYEDLKLSNPLAFKRELLENTIYLQWFVTLLNNATKYLISKKYIQPLTIT